MTEIVKKILPHVVAVTIFAVVTLVYFSPLFDGKQLRQGDIVQANGNMKEVNDFREKTGEEALWTNSIFGGMPAYQISVHYHNNILKYVNNIMTGRLPAPAYMLFAAMLGFYIMLLCFKADPWLSIAGAFAYGFSTYFLLIIGAGHNTKMHALGYLPPVIGGLYLAFERRKLWPGVIVTCLALGLQIRANHLQITYYTAIIILIFLVFELVNIARNRQYNTFIKTSAAMLVALVLAVGVNITMLLLTMEYTPHSTRGQSELSDTSGDQTKGLDKSYILEDYSYGIAETLNLFIPNFTGGGSIGKVGTDSPFYDALIRHGASKQNAAEMCKGIPTYWGDQRYTAGPVYIGAVVVFLFVLGLFVVKGRIKWWLVTATVVSIVLAWGKHCSFLSNIFIDYFPMYNKFRTVSMILVIAEFTVPLLGILALKEIFGDNLTRIDKQKALKNSFFITGGIALFFMLFSGLFFNFTAPGDAQLSSMGYLDWMIAALPDTREELLRHDALRSLLFVAAAAVVLWFTIRGNLKMKAACTCFAALILVDLWTVDKRFLNDSNFERTKKANTVQPSQADQAVLQDKSPDYRVLNIGADTFNEAVTAVFHKSLGGYHGAKMKRYQELIEHRLTPEINAFIANLQSAKTDGDISKIFRKCPAINMLNTKYVIYNPSQPPLSNPDALGNAWPVSDIEWVDNADAEIAALADFNPAKTAVIDRRYQSVLGNFTTTHDSTAVIRLAGYEPNHLTYEYLSEKPQLVVFAEIFYDKGWKAYIDGQLTPHVRADYVLRALAVPAGEHQVVFKFEPKSYALGERISLASSIAIILLILGAVGYYWYNKKTAPGKTDMA